MKKFIIAAVLALTVSACADGFGEYEEEVAGFIITAALIAAGGAFGPF